MYQAGFLVSLRAVSAAVAQPHGPRAARLHGARRGFTLTEFREAQFARTRLFRAIQGLFERYDVLVTPTLTRTALPADFDAANGEIEIEGEPCGITRQGWTSYHVSLQPHGPSGADHALRLRGGWAADGRATRRALGRGHDAAAPRRDAGTGPPLGAAPPEDWPREQSMQPGTRRDRLLRPPCRRSTARCRCPASPRR